VAMGARRGSRSTQERWAPSAMGGWETTRVCKIRAPGRWTGEHGAGRRWEGEREARGGRATGEKPRQGASTAAMEWHRALASWEVASSRRREEDAQRAGRRAVEDKYQRMAAVNKNLRRAARG
jgi:hypothetical protein